MDFTNIVGQKDITNSLINAVEYDRVGHAYLFSGPRGIGKKTVARAFSLLLLCENRSHGKSCGCCVPCRLFSSGSNPDYKEVKTEGANIGIDEVRGIQRDIAVKPMYSGRKVYLIADADRMTVQAQNCLLKTLEEPPGYAVIILTASNCEALLPTISSRVVRYNFCKNTFEEVCALLENRMGIDFARKEFIAAYADGVIGTALELAGSDEFVLLREKAIEIVFRLKNCSFSYLSQVFEFFQDNKDNIDIILDVMALCYRDLLIAKKGLDENMLINFDKKDIILSSVSAFSPQNLLRNIEIIELARKNIKHNANYQLTIEIMLMKLREEYC